MKSWTLSSWNYIYQVTFSFLFQYNIDGSNVNEETVSHLRQRLNVMREICKVTYIISTSIIALYLISRHCVV